MEGIYKDDREVLAGGRFGPAWKEEILICLSLLLCTLIIYGQTINFEFISLDDAGHVYDNRNVTDGLSLRSLRWSMTTGYEGDFNPLTWLSHIISWEAFGADAGGHHLVNVLIHSLNGILLFLVLRALTGCRWESAVVALLFSIHPLHVESVAWVSERKDVLCGLFWILTIGAYTGYVRRPRSFGLYAGCTLAFGAALHSKPMAVTLPFVLLLLDYWPLKRLANSEGISRRGGDRLSPTAGWVILEKIPLFIMAGIVAVISFSVTKDAGALPSLENISLPDRMENALVSYLGQLIWPQDLAIFYPHPRGGLPLWQVICDSGLLILITAAVARVAVLLPYLLVGWCWYLGTLVPVIGIVQAGEQAMADRYTYLTQIGLYIALVWGMRDLSVHFPRLRNSIFAGTALISVCLTVGAWHQARIWRDSETVFRHALQATRNNDTVHTFLAEVFIDEGRYEEAEAHCYKALRIEPNHSGAHYNFGDLLARMQMPEQATIHYEAAIRLRPRFEEAHINLGVLFYRNGDLGKAARYFESALEINPDNPVARNNLQTLKGKLKDSDG